MNQMDPNTPDFSPLAQELIQNEAPDAELYALLRELEETADELRVELEARSGSRQQLEGEAVQDIAAQDIAAQDTGAAATAEAPVASAGVADGTAAETEARPHRKVNPNVTPEQEEELKNFPEYWANSKGSWSNLFKLLRELRAEMREGRNHA